MQTSENQIWHYSLDELPTLVAHLDALFRHIPIWFFQGPVGAGKTTLIRALGQYRGVQSPIQSPTFSIVNEYEDQEGEPIYHFDCYRLTHVHEALDMGMEEYLSSGYSCWIEWPDRIIDLWPASFVQVTFRFTESSQRELEVQWIQN